MTYAARRVLLATILFATVLGARADAQQRAFTAADYDRAARWLAQNLNGMVVGGSVQANWLPDDRFWYRKTTAAGSEFVLVDPARKTLAPAFDHARIATALSTAANQTVRPNELPFQQIQYSTKADSIAFDLNARRWSCDARGTKCTDIGVAVGGQGGGGRGGRGGGGGRAGGAGGAPPLTLSPDGKRGAFIRDWNLWVRDIATGQEKQLTRDGVKDFGYATDNAGWAGSDRAILLWSPDSK
ncbi:MAG: DPP IV N-terminal domain-containing protein, partial [Gemmatimonadota bacterium]